MNVVGPTPLEEALYRRRSFSWHVYAGRVKVVLIIGIMCAALLALGTVLAYRARFPHPVLSQLSRTLPLPAYSVNGDMVTYRELETWMTLMQHTRVNEEALARAIDVSMEQKVLRQIADDLGVEFDQVRVGEVMETLLAAYASPEEARIAIAETYGIGMQSFQMFVAEPIVLSEQLAGPVSDHEVWQQEARARAERVHRAAFRDPSLLGDLGQDGVGSDVRTTIDAPLSTYPSEARGALSSTPAGLVAPLVEVQEGFLVYHILERPQDGVQTGFSTRSVLIPKTTVQEVRDNLVQEAKTIFFIRREET